MTVNGLRSEWATVTSGVPQGTVLGPLLFVIFVNDMPGEISSSIKMFADDTKVYRSVNQASDIHLLQADLDALLQWSERWQFPFNREKCKTLHLGCRNDNHVYNMGGTQLAQTSVERLGDPCGLSAEVPQASDCSSLQGVACPVRHLMFLWSPRRNHPAATVPDNSLSSPRVHQCCLGPIQPGGPETHRACPEKSHMTGRWHSRSSI